MYFIYSVGLGILLALAAPVYAWKGRRSGKYLRTFRARLGRLPPDVRSDGGAIWIHAVSVGEVLAARALIEPLRQRLPGRRVFVSTTTLTGQEVARASLKGVDGLFFAPFDFVFAVRRVLQAIRPSLLVIVETEIWPNLIRETRRSGARVAIVNGRLSPRSFPRYRRIRGFLRPVLAEVDVFLMQAEPHAVRARAIGAPADRVRVSGNLKFDALPAGGSRSSGLDAVFAGPRGPVWVAGSTVAGEEVVVLAAFRALKNEVPDLRLVLAPRHPERFTEVPPMARAAGFQVACRSALEGRPWGSEDVLVLDTLGELAHAYAFATVVFVGGSLSPAGGHNILEPAVAARAVVVGPHMENFQEIARAFLEEDALVQVAAADALAPAILRLLRDPAARDQLGARARDLVERNRGALDRTVQALAELVA